MRGEPLVLGIGAVPGGGACLLRGAEPLVAIEESRLSRIVGDSVKASAPSLAIQYCLESTGTAPGDLDHITCAVEESDESWRSDAALNPQLQIASRGLALSTIGSDEAQAVGESVVRGALSSTWAGACAVTIGAAFCALRAVTGRLAEGLAASAFRGRTYTDREILTALSAVPGLSWRDAAGGLLDEIEDRLSQGQLGGWFRGQSRFGQDARLQRSLVCALPRMETATRVRPVGGTIRKFQPVAMPPGNESHDRWRALTTGLERRAGTLALFSAPFHADGEPIVETPSDALWLVLEADLDFCAIEDRVVVRNPHVESLLDLVPALRLVTYTITHVFPRGQLETSAARARVSVDVPKPWGTVTARLNPLQCALLEAVDGHRTGYQLLERLGDRGQATLSREWLRRTLIQLGRLGLVDLTSRGARGHA